VSPDIQYLKQWAGKTESRSDQVTVAPIAALSATLDRDDRMPQAGDLLPPLWHWLYFLPMHRQSDIGADGHPNRGGFLPPVPLPRRMWAGGRLTFLQALRVGESVERVSRVVSVECKEGRSGPLVFVLVRHEISNAAGIAIVEEHDIVYRDMPAAGAPQAASAMAPIDASWERNVHPDDVLLFRYSALTFNSHRIHYNRDYVTTVEGYPGLVVHGPLIATLLLDLLRRHMPGATVAAFTFRAVQPMFDIADFSVCGKPSDDGKSVALWAKDASGRLAMEAGATLA
jgi:3-methylfumaryl-CoA hydratase